MYKLSSCDSLTCCEPVRLVRTCYIWLPGPIMSAKFRLMESKSGAISMFHFPFLPFLFAFCRLHGEKVIILFDPVGENYLPVGKFNTLVPIHWRVCLPACPVYLCFFALIASSLVTMWCMAFGSFIIGSRIFLSSSFAVFSCLLLISLCVNIESHNYSLWRYLLIKYTKSCWSACSVSIPPEAAFNSVYAFLVLFYI